MGDPVNHPDHYNQRTASDGIECIDLIEWMPFNVGSAVKYVWRYKDKKDPAEDLEKALWYLERELKRLDAEHMRDATLDGQSLPMSNSRWGRQAAPEHEMLQKAIHGASPLLQTVLSCLPSSSNTPGTYRRGLAAAFSTIATALAGLRA